MAISTPPKTEPSTANALALPSLIRQTAASAGRAWLPAASFIVALVLWQAAVVIFDIRPYTLPSPIDVFERVWTARTSLWDNALVTGYEVLMGFLLAAVVSIPLAFVIASVRLFERAFYPLIVVLQTVPKIAVAPLFIVWFGFGQLPKILLTFLLCFFPILVDAISGFKALDPRLLYITRSMGASRWQTFRFVRMPAAMPFIFSGLKVAVVMAVTGALVAEFVGSNAGLGYLLLRASSLLDTALIFAVLVVLSVMGLLFSNAIELLERLATPWNRKDS